MSGPRLTAAEGRAMDRMVAASSDKATLAWAKGTLERFPFRSDLRDIIAKIEAKNAKSNH